MKRLLVAFDVDDTLITPQVEKQGGVWVPTGPDVPNYEMVAVYRWFQAQGHIMVVWSGGGEDYARMCGEKLGLNADVYRDKHDASPFVFSHEPYEKDTPDLAFDDSDIELATVNVKVKRANNGYVRYPDRVAAAVLEKEGGG